MTRQPAPLAAPRRAGRARARRRTTLAALVGIAAVAALPVAAAAAPSQDCLDEGQIRAAATRLNAVETVPLLGSRGTHYLLVVFADHGLVFTTAGACGRTALRLSPTAMKRVLAKTLAH